MAALVVTAFGLSFIAMLQLGGEAERPSQPRAAAESTRSAGARLATAEALPELADAPRSRPPRESRAKTVSKRQPRRPRRSARPARPVTPAVGAAPVPAAVPVRPAPAAPAAPPPAATPAPTSTPVATPTPVPTFDDRGEPNSGEFDYGDGG